MADGSIDDTVADVPYGSFEKGTWYGFNILESMYAGYVAAGTAEMIAGGALFGAAFSYVTANNLGKWMMTQFIPGLEGAVRKTIDTAFGTVYDTTQGVHDYAFKKPEPET